MTWTMERIDRLRFLWAEGWSASEVAYDIGKTRNAVIGKAHRLGLTQGPRKPQQAGADRPKTRKESPSMPTRAGIAAMPLKPVPEAPMGPGLPLIYVTGCKYPVANSSDGTHLFCNAPSHENGPWCEYHRGVCYQKQNPDAKPKRFKIPTSLLRAVA